MRPLICRSTALAVLLAALLGIYACAGTASLTRPHPEKVTGPPQCSKCHENTYADLDHTDDFGQRHRFPAAQREQLCWSCHRQSFCADCHADREELKPSQKYQDSPGRYLPHRGDYLIRHRIDGQINPASCFPCHGRKNDWRCRQCHR